MQCQPVVDKQGLNEHSAGAPKDFEKGRSVTMRKGFMEKKTDKRKKGHDTIHHTKGAVNKNEER